MKVINHTEEIIEVEGSLSEIILFHDIWQSSVWHNWKTADNNAARSERDKCLRAWSKSGRAKFSARGYQRGIEIALSVLEAQHEYSV